MIHKTLTTFYQNGNYPHKLQVNRFAKCFVQPPDKQTSTTLLERNHGINDGPITIKGQSRHENLDALIQYKLANGAPRKFQAASDVEQRVVFAKQAKLARKDSSQQFDYKKEKMVPIAIQHGKQMKTIEQFNSNKEEYLKKACNQSATLSPPRKAEQDDLVRRQSSAEQIVDKKVTANKENDVNRSVE